MQCIAFAAPMLPAKTEIGAPRRMTFNEIVGRPTAQP